MDKRKFLILLQKGLSGMPQEDINERLNFYSEMIDDYMEEGLAEEEAVARIGSVNEIVTQIIGDTPQPDSTPATKRRNPWKIAMILLSSPIWLPLLISAFVIVFSLFISLWSIIISMWSVFAALASSSFGCTLGGVAMIFAGFGTQGAAMIGVGLVCGGLSVFMFYACKAATKATALLTKKLVLQIKRRMQNA